MLLRRLGAALALALVTLPTALASSGSVGAASCRPPAGVPASARQVVVVDADGTYAEVDLLVKRGGVWRCRRTDMNARVGRNGIRPLAQRVAGDGTTPAGIFPLGTMRAPAGQRFQFFGNGANPGVADGWRQVGPRDCWDATGGDAGYNTLVRRTAGNCPSPNEYLPRYQTAYAQAALIGANMGPRRSGDEPGETPRAAAIFLHRHSFDGGGATKPTSGCVSLGRVHLGVVIRTLRPGTSYFVIR
jgi:L,D-peptidoglycan transpeptidase YkuD (ErfK/YbiS/YcfS/YnhG family)